MESGCERPLSMCGCSSNHRTPHLPRRSRHDLHCRPSNRCRRRQHIRPPHRELHEAYAESEIYAELILGSMARRFAGDDTLQPSARQLFTELVG